MTRIQTNSRWLPAITFLTTLLCTPFTLAQDDVVYPANADDVSYAELDNLPDFRGLWFYGFGGGPVGDPPLKGAYKEHYESELAKLEADPFYEISEGANNCEAPGMPYFMTMPYALEFMFTPGKVTVVQEAHMMIRRIFTDGRPFPADPDPTYFGDSRGHWEGDTLVVETRNTRAGQRLGIAGITNSEKLVIHERIYLNEDNPNQLHVDFIFEDEDALTAPWAANYTFRRDRTWEMLEYICDENDRHPMDADGQTQVILAE